MDEMPWFFKIFNQKMFKKEEKMREILFRGKTKEGKWVEGSLVRWLDECFIANMPTFDQREPGKYLFGNFAKVLPETVGQYTGLKDKNGKRIFEGDILLEDRDGIPVAWEVKWSNATLRKWSIDKTAEEQWISEPISRKDNIEIVGHVLTDYELLIEHSYEKYSLNKKRKATDERTDETIQPAQG